MSSCLPSRTIRRQRTLIALSLIAALSTCAAGQDKTPSTKSADQKPTVAKGEIVSEMAKDLWYVFQGKNGHYWFGSHSEGLFRYDGKTITRFASKDGLAGVQMGGIQEDKSGNIYFSTDKGISKFDGRSFTTLEPKAAGEWKKEPDDLWFGGG
jgi:ligand-binding sensor domain-containing protein